MVGDTVAQLLVEIGADLSGLMDGLQTAKGALEQFATTSGGAADEQDVFGDRVSARLRALTRDYQTLGQSESEAAASAEALRGAMESSVLAASQRRTDKFTPSQVDPLDAAISTRLSQVAQQYQLLGQSTTEAAASAQLLRPAIEEAVTDQAQARIERLAPSAKEATGAFVGLREEFSKIGQIAVGFATGMLAANLAMGVAERFQNAAEAADKFGLAVAGVQRLTGATAESSSLMLGTLERYGMTAEAASTALIKLDRSIAGIEDPLEVVASGGRSGAQQLRNLGIAGSDAMDVMLQLADKLQGMSAAEQIGVIASVFKVRGNEAADLQRILMDGRASIEQYFGFLQSTGNYATQPMVDDAVKLQVAHKELDRALQGLSIQLGSVFMPAVATAAAGMTALTKDIVSGLVPAIQRMPDLVPAAAAVMGVLLVGAAINASIAMISFAVSGIGSVVGAVPRLIAAVGSMVGAFAVEGTAAEGAAAATGAAWLTTTGPVVLAAVGIAAAIGVVIVAATHLKETLIAVGVVTAAVVAGPFVALASAVKLIQMAMSGQLGDVKDALVNIKDEIAQSFGQMLEGPKDALNGVWDQALAAAQKSGEDATAKYMDGLKRAVATGTPGAAQAVAEATKSQLQDLQEQQEQRKLDFDSSHVDMETDALNTKLAETQANAQLLDYKQQLDDLDRSAVDYAHQRLQLDEQDAVTRAKIAESALKNNDEDLSYQQRLLKAELLASHRGGPAVDSSAIHSELRQLHAQQIREAPALLIAEHNTSLAERTQSSASLADQLKNSSVQRAKIDIEQAMQPFVDAATAAKRVAENAQTAFDLEKQKFAIEGQSYQLALLRAQLDSKKAEHDLYTAQHPEAAAPVINVGGVTVNTDANGGSNHLAIVDAVYTGITKAVQDAKSPPVVLSPRVGGARYAAA